MNEPAEPTVVVRCGACRRPIGRIPDDVRRFPPPDHSFWLNLSRGVWFEPCIRHGGLKGTIQEFDALRERLGKPRVSRSSLMIGVRWRDLRPAYDKSVVNGKPFEYVVGPE